jgi:hypothetical protein
MRRGVSPPTRFLVGSRIVDRDEPRKKSVPRWYALLLVPFVGMLWVPFYDSLEPRAFGIPYFYWYQFLWILVGAAITGIVYFATREPQP